MNQLDWTEVSEDLSASTNEFWLIKMMFLIGSIPSPKILLLII